MKIQVIREALNCENSMELGGEYAVSSLEIYIDQSLPPRTQTKNVIHAVIENYCPNWGHEQVDELTGYIEDGLDQLGE